MVKTKGRPRGRTTDSKIEGGIPFLCVLNPELHERLSLEAKNASTTMAKIFRIALKKFFDNLDHFKASS